MNISARQIIIPKNDNVLEIDDTETAKNRRDGLLHLKEKCMTVSVCFSVVPVVVGKTWSPVRCPQ